MHGTQFDPIRKLLKTWNTVPRVGFLPPPFYIIGYKIDSWGRLDVIEIFNGFFSQLFDDNNGSWWFIEYDA